MAWNWRGYNIFSFLTRLANEIMGERESPNYWNIPENINFRRYSAGIPWKTKCIVRKEIDKSSCRLPDCLPNLMKEKIINQKVLSFGNLLKWLTQLVWVDKWKLLMLNWKIHSIKQHHIKIMLHNFFPEDCSFERYQCYQ